MSDTQTWCEFPIAPDSDTGLAGRIVDGLISTNTRLDVGPRASQRYDTGTRNQNRWEPHLLVGGAGDDNFLGDRSVGVGDAQNWDIRRVSVADAGGQVGSRTLVFTGINQGMGGDPQGDAIFAGAGNDWVLADGGDDFVDAGTGDDVAYGGAGADVLRGGLGADVLYGDGTTADPTTLDYTAQAEHGNDLIDAGEGNDQVFAGGGDDAVTGGDGNDSLFGGAGHDLMEGGDGADLLLGDSDTLAGDSHGDDTLDGGSGDDQMLGNGGVDQLTGGDGNDTLAGDDRVLAAQYHGNDYVDGGLGDDYLEGNGGADELFGGDGNDTLAGDDRTLAAQYHDNDYLDGEAGDDYLEGNGGSDVLFGGEGWLVEHMAPSGRFQFGRRIGRSASAMLRLSEHKMHIRRWEPAYLASNPPPACPPGQDRAADGSYTCGTGRGNRPFKCKGITTVPRSRAQHGPTAGMTQERAYGLQRQRHCGSQSGWQSTSIGRQA